MSDQSSLDVAAAILTKTFIESFWVRPRGPQGDEQEIDMMVKYYRTIKKKITDPPQSGSA